MTAFQLAHRFVGEVHELPGEHADHPLIAWWLSLCGYGFDVHDEIPWCSAFVNGIAWELRLPRSKSAAARSWLGVGEAIELSLATAEHCIVILKRGTNPAQGHVGFFAGIDDASGEHRVRIIGGNQGNQVSIATFPERDVIGVRRLM